MCCLLVGLLYLLLQLSGLLLQQRRLGSGLCTSLGLLLQVLDLPVDKRKQLSDVSHLFQHTAADSRCLTSADTP